MKRFGSATWSGSLRDGKGAVSTESQAMKNHPVHVLQLVTARRRAPILRNCSAPRMRRASPCRSLECSERRTSSRSGVDSKSDVVIEKDADGFSITSVHLTVTARIPGIDQDTFQSIAAKAKAGCPVSKLIKVEIGFEATLGPK